MRAYCIQKHIRFAPGQKPGAGVVHLGHVHLLKGTVALVKPPFLEFVDHVPHIAKNEAHRGWSQSFSGQGKLVIFQLEGSDFIYRFIREKRSRVDAVSECDILTIVFQVREPLLFKNIKPLAEGDAVALLGLLRRFAVPSGNQKLATPTRTASDPSNT